MAAAKMKAVSMLALHLDPPRGLAKAHLRSLLCRKGLKDDLLGWALAILPLLAGCLGGLRAEPSVAHQVPDGKPYNGPTVDFTWSPLEPRAGEAVYFKPQVYALKGTSIQSWLWHLGEGETDDRASPAYIYSNAGIYNVNVKVTTTDGLSGSARHAVVVAWDKSSSSASPRPGSSSGKTSAGNSSNPEPPYDSNLPVMRFGAPVTAVEPGPQGSQRRGGEPSLAIDAKGAFYVNPPGTLVKSSDGGKTWWNLPYPVPYSGDSQVIVDPDGRLYVADLLGGNFGLGGPCTCSTSVYASTDDGATWTGTSLAGYTPFNDRPWVASVGGGVAYVWYNFQPLSSANRHLMAKTTDGGKTWVPLPGFEDSGWNSFLFADQKDGTIYAVKPTGSGVAIQASTDGGQSFTSHAVAETGSNPNNGPVSGATDDAGAVYVAWSNEESGRWSVRMASSSDKGATWSQPAVVSTMNGTQIFPWIAAGADGKVVVAWYGADQDGDENTLPASTQWHVYAAQSLDARASNPTFSTVLVSPEPIHAGAICTNGSACTGNRGLLDFFMVQITPDGRAAVAYAQDRSTQTASTMFALQDSGPRLR
jgi:photosystem II stability/assembly factor-like uncharacterized protein